MTRQQLFMMGLFGAIGLVFGLVAALFIPWPAAMLAQVNGLPIPQALTVLGITALFCTVGAMIGSPNDRSRDP